MLRRAREPQLALFDLEAADESQPRRRRQRALARFNRRARLETGAREASETGAGLRWLPDRFKNRHARAIAGS